MGYPIKHLPFKPDYGNNKITFPYSTSVSINYGKGSYYVRLVNSGSNICYVKFGIGSQTATTSDMPILSGEAIIIRKDQSFDNVAFISDLGTELNLQTSVTTGGSIVIPEPYNTGSLRIWLDGSDPASIELSSSKVVTWFDKSGNGNHATQATDSKRPVYDGSNITFDGTNDYLQSLDSASLSVTGDLSIIAVVNSTANALDQCIVTKDGNSAYRNKVLASGNLLWMLINDGVGFEFKQSTSGIDRDQNVIIESEFDAGNFINFYKNGVSIGQQATTKSSIADTAGNLFIGAFNDAGTEKFNGRINEILIFGKKLSSDERSNIVRFLTEKWL